VDFTTATAWAAAAAELGIDAEIAERFEIAVASAPGRNDAEPRPRGPLFGSLVHAVLAAVPLDASAETIERIAATHGRLLSDVTPADIRAASVVVAGVLRHELLARARASARVRRETPVSWRQQDGTLVEGVLDLAFDEGDATVVVDFKTDHELAAGETRYRAQLQQYLGAVTRATGRPVRGVLFKI
jgi:ATP-dependent exoDNAse (exonuclease V) beta subunit